jgi:uroporphyrinogen decarboxylase
MSSKERVLKTIKREKVDRIPLDGDFHPLIWKRLKEYYGTNDDEAIRDNLGIDFRMVFMEPSLEFKKKAKPSPVSLWDIGEGKDNLVISLPDNVFEDEWEVRRQPTSSGQVWRYVHHPLSKIRSLDEYIFPDIESLGRFDGAEQQIKMYNHRYIIATEMWNFFKHAWELRGFENFLSDLYTNSSFVEELLHKLLELKIKQVRRLVEIGVDIIEVAGDIGMQSSMILSPEVWRRYFKPRLKELIQETKRGRNPYFFFHSDGYIKPVIPDIIEIGFDILDPIQPESMDPVEIKRLYGERLTLHGTISTQRTLPFGKREDVKREVIDRIKRCGEEGGLVLAPSNTVMPDVPVENILTLYETAKEFSTI